MNMKTCQALIQWMNLRLTTPVERYSAPAEFEGHEGELWSLNVKMGKPFDLDMRVYYADVWFLADTAPHDWLKPNARFVLYEGTKIVAVGRCEHEYLEIKQQEIN
jgi:hypothetical protein